VSLFSSINKKEKKMKKSLIVFLLEFLILVGIAHTQVKLEGYFEGQFGKTYDSESFKWNMWDPNYYLETRLTATPIANTEAYLKFYADKWNQAGQQMDHSESILSEGHIKFRQEYKGRGIQTIFFTRESGNYWTDGSMLNILNTGSVNNDGNGQGGRLDLWESWGGSATYVFSDFSSGVGDDIHLLRLRQSFLHKKLFTGIFYQRKNYGTGGQKDYNEVVATDIKIQFGRYFFNGELAFGNVPSEQEVVSLNKSYQEQGREFFKKGKYYDGLKEFFKENIATKVEFRGMRLGTPQLGYWYVNPCVWSYGKCYRNYMGENKYDEYGYGINSYYFVPQRAITLTCNYSQYKKHEAEEYSTGKSCDPVTNLYSEAYIEFINGFKGKVYYNKKDEVWHGGKYKHYDFFAELSVENRLAKLLTQFKIKDIGDTWEKQIAGIECAVNLTDRWRAFARGMIVNDRVGSRSSIFGELLYRIGSNTELYLQYGPSWWGAYGLVNDDGFVSGGYMKKEIKLILKGWF